MMTTNAPVGPLTGNRLPLKNAMKKPATMDVYSPRSGVRPEAMANASASGSATTPTVIPAEMSLDSIPRLYPLRIVLKRLGTSGDLCCAGCALDMKPSPPNKTRHEKMK